MAVGFLQQVSQQTTGLSYFSALAIYGAITLAVSCPLLLDPGSMFQLANLFSLTAYFIGGPTDPVFGRLLYAYAAASKKISASFYLFLTATGQWWLSVSTPSSSSRILLESTLHDGQNGTNKVKKPITVAIVSDLQTDHVSSYDINRSARQGPGKEKPDLILMPGDYVQCLTMEKQLKEMARFTALLKRLDFKAPLGAYAVRGNAEQDGWPLEFAGTAVSANEKTTLYPLKDLDVVGLSFADSFNADFKPSAALKAKLAPSKKYRIIFGHGPDFALAHPEADLLVAGHTHGGQVRLPLIGPILTLCKVPRAWAAGRTQIDAKTTLVVSRGVGMERRYAPRLRFLCRPQLVFITLEPATK